MPPWAKGTEQTQAKGPERTRQSVTQQKQLTRMEPKRAYMPCILHGASLAVLSNLSCAPQLDRHST